MTTKIEFLKALARKANAEKDWDFLRSVIEQLEVFWKDNHGAMAFYTELEQTALAAEEA